MVLNIFLAISAIAGSGILWYRISHKIPELVAIPDEVIVMRLHEDSARVRIFVLHLKTFWREPRYQEAFWRFCAKALYRAHIVLLRADNGLALLLRRVRNHAGSIAESIEPERSAPTAPIQAAAAVPMPRSEEIATVPPRRRSSVRVREVRPRRKTTPRTGGLQE